MGIEVSTLNGYVPLFESSRDYQRKREELADAAQTVAIVVDELADGWQSVGLSEREAEVAAYRQLGFTNKATAWMLKLSSSTVNEYTRRAKEKIAEARALVNYADRTEAFETHWNCPDCGKNIQRSNADIEVDLDSKQIDYGCRELGCFADMTRRIYYPSP